MEQTHKQLGKYALLEHIATGGMAEIWLASQQGPGGFHKQLVIKRILPHLAQDRTFTQMFLDEARTVAQLAHPNVGQIFDLGQEDDAYFIAMEYIEGADLNDLVTSTYAQGERIPLGIVLYMMTQLLGALEYAHSFVDREGRYLQIVHRDVTPHNVIVSYDGVVKLVDFGVAKATQNRSKTQSGGIKGKFAYMAPEQINAVADLDLRADIFGAGVSLYEMLTGVKPFGDELFAVNAILNAPMPDPREHRPDLPEALVRILELALAKDRASRYQNAHDMAEDLEDLARASALRLSQRDVANFVRSASGKEPAHTSSTGIGPRALGPQSEAADDADLSDTYTVPAIGTNPGEPLVPQTGPNDVVDTLGDTMSSPAVGPPPPAEDVASQERGGQSVQNTVTMAAQEVVTTARSNKTLVAAFAGLLLALILAGGLVTLIVLGDDSGQVAPLEQGPVANPNALMHEDGHLVFIRAPKDTKVYYEGEFIGRGTIQTTLRKGSYPLALESPKGTSATQIKVERSMQTFELGS